MLRRKMQNVVPCNCDRFRCARPRDGKCIRHRPREKRHLHQEYARQPARSPGKAFVIRLAFGYIRRRKRKCKAGSRAQGRDNELPRRDTLNIARDRERVFQERERERLKNSAAITVKRLFADSRRPHSSWMFIWVMSRAGEQARCYRKDRAREIACPTSATAARISFFLRIMEIEVMFEIGFTRGPTDGERSSSIFYPYLSVGTGLPAEGGTAKQLERVASEMEDKRMRRCSWISRYWRPFSCYHETVDIALILIICSVIYRSRLLHRVIEFLIFCINNRACSQLSRGKRAITRLILS